MKTNNRHKLDTSYINCVNIDNARFLDQENPTLMQYLREVRKFKPMTPEEELEHIVNYQKRTPGYEKDLELVMGYNQRFVIMIVKRYCPTNIDICDLINEANIGMMEAIEKFDVNFGTKFITYASRLIIKYVFEFLENSGFIKQPNRSKIHGVIDKITEEFFSTNGYYPTIDELDEEFKKRGVVVKDKSDFVTVTVESMDMPVTDDDDENVREFGEVDNFEGRVNNDFVRKALLQAIETLPEIERTILIKTYGFDGCEESVSTIAFELGISEYKVNAYLEKALAKLRQNRAMFE